MKKRTVFSTPVPFVEGLYETGKSVAQSFTLTRV